MIRMSAADRPVGRKVIVIVGPDRGRVGAGCIRQCRQQHGRFRIAGRHTFGIPRRQGAVPHVKEVAHTLLGQGRRSFVRFGQDGRMVVQNFPSAVLVVGHVEKGISGRDLVARDAHGKFINTAIQTPPGAPVHVTRSNGAVRPPCQKPIEIVLNGRRIATGFIAHRGQEYGVGCVSLHHATGIARLQGVVPQVKQGTHVGLLLLLLVFRFNTVAAVGLLLLVASSMSTTTTEPAQRSNSKEVQCCSSSSSSSSAGGVGTKELIRASAA
mmetsp:Transcript_19032/g.40965  ORF Transcript_19032/g.40965 Transcript_19032/m.40965 type:complete len:268 (+) Transcript_19032:636-1439(+)